jgi:hypothetical protein
MENFKGVLQAFIQTLHQYDYYAFYWLGAVAFFALLLALVVSVKKPTLSAMMLLVMILTVFVGPFITYKQIHNYLYGTNVELTYIKQMQFADVLLLRGKITSYGEERIDKCRLHTFVIPPQDGFLENIEPLFVLNPIKKKTTVVETQMENGDSEKFMIKFKDFKHSKEINSSHIYIYPECFSEGKK